MSELKQGLNKVETSLLQCPFCGGEVLMTSDMADAFHEYFSFECVSCDMVMSYQYYDKEKAIETFNTRKPMDDIVERLEEVKAKPTELCYDVPLIESIIKIVKGEV